MCKRSFGDFLQKYGEVTSELYVAKFELGDIFMKIFSSQFVVGTWVRRYLITWIKPYDEKMAKSGEKYGLMVTLVKASENDGTPRSNRG